MALPQQHRLKGHRAFDLLYQKGRKFHGPFLLLRLIEARPELLPPPQRLAPASAWRCGVVVSSKVSKRAVRRNRIRRLPLLPQPRCRISRACILQLAGPA